MKEMMIMTESKDEEDRSFSADELQREMENDPDWYKALVQCYYCPVFTKNCSFKKYKSKKKYFCTCTIRPKK